jgi:uracil-DNA glycosylase family 4
VEPRGKRRIHQKPNADEIAACRPWLNTELAVVKPKVLVCLGATAAMDEFVGDLVKGADPLADGQRVGT